MTDSTIKSGAPAPEARKVGVLLGVGIFFLPYVFAWFVLRAGYSTLARIVSFAWMILSVLVVAMGQGTSDSSSLTDGTAPAAATTSAATSARANSEESDAGLASTNSAPASNWSYSQDVDEMRNATTYYAQVTSDNQLEFDFPYNGGSSGTITVRKSPVHGTDVMLQVSKGQFICSSFSGDTIKAKFDDGPILRFGCNEPADATTGLLFIEGASKFIAALKKSKKVVVEAQFFQEGNRQLTFQTAGLEWKH